MDCNNDARAIFADALAGAEVHARLRSVVYVNDSVLHAGERTFLLAQFQACSVVAVGKAAVPMAKHVCALLQPHLPTGGLIVGPLSEAAPSGFDYRTGSHPLPDEASREAAHAALRVAGEATPHTLMVWLISGGASAMMDAPLDAIISTADMTAFHRTLVHCGLPIGQMNALRKHMSAVKGGRLAVAAQCASAQLTLLVSDVPDGQIDSVGSGPTLPDSSTVADCRQTLHQTSMALPASVAEWFERSPPETPKPDDPAFARCFHVVLASSATLCDAAVASARRMGYTPVVDTACDEWPFDRAAQHLMQRLHTSLQMHSKVALISAGELSVPVPTAAKGHGGRNQHFALYAAQLLGQEGNACVLSAGSDGIDGNSQAAGAVCDTSTWSDPDAAQQALDSFDSSTFLSGLQQTIVTGPTGNNLRDLRVLLASRAPL